LTARTVAIQLIK